MLLAFQQVTLDKPLKLGLLKRRFIKSHPQAQKVAEKGAMVKGSCFLPIKTQKAPEIKDFCVRVQNCCPIMSYPNKFEPLFI